MTEAPYRPAFVELAPASHAAAAALAWDAVFDLAAQPIEAAEQLGARRHALYVVDRNAGGPERWAYQVFVSDRMFYDMARSLRANVYNEASPDLALSFTLYTPGGALAVTGDSRRNGGDDYGARFTRVDLDAPAAPTEEKEALTDADNPF